MPEPIVALNEESLKDDLRELVRKTVEDTLNGLLEEEEAGDLVRAERHVILILILNHYVQYRDASSLTSSLDRQSRQIQYLEAFASKALASAKGNVTSLVDLFNVAGEYSVTNLGVNEFGYLASSVLTNGITSLEMVTLPGEPVQGAQFVEVHLDEEAVYQTVLDVYYTRVD